MRFYYNNCKFNPSSLLADCALADLKGLRVSGATLEEGIAKLQEFQPDRDASREAEEFHNSRENLHSLLSYQEFPASMEVSLRVLGRGVVQFKHNKILDLDYVLITWTDGRFSGCQSFRTTPELQQAWELHVAETLAE